MINYWKSLLNGKAREGIKIGKENLLVTVSSQQGLDLIGKILIDPSDPVVVELPSYLGGLQVFNGYGAHLYGIKTDDDGILVDRLEESLERLRKTEEHYKFVYLVPDFQNPAGVTLSHERRKKIIELSHKYEVIIIEDTPYRELRFEGKAPPPLKAMDTTDNVISVHTFSKIFVPGLRLGWVVAHPDIIRKLTLANSL